MKAKRRRPRSGSHLIQRGEIYYYRRGVPKDVRDAFGCTEVVKSLETTSESEAKKLEKQHDVEFERRLQRARDNPDPESRQARTASEIVEATPFNHGFAQWALEYVPAEDQEGVRDAITPYYVALSAHGNEVARLTREIAQAFPRKPFEPEIWQRCRDGILSMVRQHIATITGEGATPIVDGIHTLEWAYSRWLRTRAGQRADDSITTARRHFDAFIDHTKLIMLDQVRRLHVLAWRDHLVDSGQYRPNSVNQRLQLVGAILRAGWRDAEIPEQNLKGIILPNPDDNDRGSWERDEILWALTALKPHSWSAWVYLIGLTTSARIGEPMAARVDWFNPTTGMIEVNDRRFTKAKKLHCMPIIGSLRAPLIAYTRGRPGDEYLFADAPRPSNPKLRPGHEASKWFGRFFAKQRPKINRVYHELRDTWIEAAKHSPIERDIWEIISGHSAATVSDRYGGKKPDVLAAANEKICEFLTHDPEVNAAMLQLVS